MNLNIFPFYGRREDQSRYTVAGHLAAEPLYSSRTAWLPFIIKKANDGRLVDCFNIYDATDNTLYKTYTGNQVTYRYFKTSQADYIIYDGAPLPEPLPCGAFYLEIQGYYSEVFNTVSNTANLLQITWSNSTNIDDLLYQVGFSQKAYINASLATPTTKTEDEGEQDGYGNFVPTLVKMQRFISFTAGLLLPYQADALAALQLHNKVTIAEYSEVKQLTTKINYPVDNYGLIGMLTVDFAEADPVISKICENSVIVEEIDTSSYTPDATLCDPNNTGPVWRPTGVVSCEIA